MASAPTFMSSTCAIVAVSSPPGRSLRGVIRISGDDLSSLCRDLFGDLPAPRRLTAMRLQLSEAGVPCLAALFPSPHSYTGDDVLEIQLPGNPALLEEVLEHLIDLSDERHVQMRLAEPGEFTRRAFLAGKLDLTQGEGIAATISATSDAQLQAAHLLRGGRLGRWAATLVDQLASALALVEAGVDFVEQDDVVPIAPVSLDDRLENIESQLRSLSAGSRAWSVIEDLPWVVLAGAPNAGKSTLFNALLGHERAVTSDTPGTTRDVLCEPLRITDGGGRPAEVMLVDLAGLGEVGGPLDAAMQSAAHDAIRRADLVIELVGRSCDAGARTPSTAPKSCSDNGQAVSGHSHILRNVRMSNANAQAVLRVGAKADVVAYEEADCDVRVSALTGQGIQTLKKRIAQRLGDRAVTLSSQMLALQPRHAAALRIAAVGIEHARAMLVDQLDANSLNDMELVAAHMRGALDALGELGGQMSPDDVLGKVFATFCIGK